MMRGEDLLELQKKYRELGDEVLLDFIHNQKDDFLPEALALIREELHCRGYKEDQIDPPAAREIEPESEGAKGPLLKIAGCHEHWIASQARNVLINEGIKCFIDDSGSLADPFAGIGQDNIQIMVEEKDFKKAKELLDTFPPLHADSD